MGRYVIINAKKTPSSIDVPDALVHHTDHAGHAIEIIREICTADPCAEIHVYGGDGSVFEAVNAIKSCADAGDVTLVVHPFGTGNDFARSFDTCDPQVIHKLDLIRFNDQYAANEINIGFDCDVVILTQKIKRIPLLGSAAYSISAILTLFKRMGKHVDLTFIDEHGNEGRINEKLLLCLAANGKYYGGGFCCAPRASLKDGLLEFVCVKKISRIKFLQFFMGYRKGKHIHEDGTLNVKFAPFLCYHRVRSITLHNVGSFCADGEIFSSDTLHIAAEDTAIRISVTPKTR